MVSIESDADILTQKMTSLLAVKGDLTNPYSYLKNKYLFEIESYNLLYESILLANKINFRINRNDIKNVYYDARKKWGMGYYPHDGKVYVETKDNKKREFIILGEQSGQNIADWIIAPPQ